MMGRILISHALLRKSLLSSSHAQYCHNFHFLCASYDSSLQRCPMQTRWVHLSEKHNQQLNSRLLQSNKQKDDTSTPSTDDRGSTEPIKMRVQKLAHFRENISQETKKEESASGLTEPDLNVHPDILEARSMQDGGYRLPHPIWTDEELESVKITHRIPETKVDKLAYYSVKMLRTGFDIFSGYTLGKWRGNLDEKQWVKRIMFLETIAGVPGMVGAMVRHLVSLRKFKRDQGWIHTLLEEAENERMHLMTAMRVANPGIIMKSCVVLAQGIFVCGFSLAYLVSARFCHRFVGYLEEEAVITYTHCLSAIDSGELKMWSRMKAPEIAIEYWKLPNDAMMRDVILAIRADEAHHRTVNHTLSAHKSDEPNPYPPGE